MNRPFDKDAPEDGPRFDLTLEPVRYAVRLLACYYSREEVWARMQKRFPEWDRREGEKWKMQLCLDEASLIVRSWYDDLDNVDALRAKSVAFYTSIIRGGRGVAIRDRIEAQKQLDKLLALHKPARNKSDDAAGLLDFLKRQAELAASEQKE